MFDPSSLQFVVTWSKCGLPTEKRLEARRDPMTWMPSISAIATLYERGCVPGDKMLAAASSIGRSYDAGDRYLLDTDDAKRAAEMVRDLAYINAGKTDLRQAIRNLIDEIAHVRFSSAPASEFDENILGPLGSAWDKCMSIEGFDTWKPASMRRRFLYCMRRKDRTQVAYTLVGILFDIGSCPLLSLSDRRTLRMMSFSKAREGCVEESAEWPPMNSAKEVFRFALEEMSAAKNAGLRYVCCKMTQQQLADSISAS